MSLTTYTTCRVCGSKNLYEFLDLGKQPAPNKLLSFKHEFCTEKFFPLRAFLCKDCGLIQLCDVVDPNLLFGNYTYYTGKSSQTMLDHFKNYAQSLEKEFKLKPTDVVVDIGGNDGTFLNSYSIPNTRINVEPSRNHAIKSLSEKVTAYPYFFSSSLARTIVETHGKAKVITASNVFAHLDNLYDFMAGVKYLLDYGGVFIVEVQHGLRLIENLEWTNIYHEHLSYFNISPLNIMGCRFDLNIFKIEELPTQGGSLRIYFGSYARTGEGFFKLSNEELVKKIYEAETFKDFKQRVDENVWELRGLLARLKEDKMKIVGYGCSAKASVMTNYANIGPETLDYIIDTTPAKQGKFSPGKHIPIVSPDVFHKDMPDYALIFPWNYTEEILNKEKDFLDSGGKFIVPCPEVKVISK